MMADEDLSAGEPARGFLGGTEFAPSNRGHCRVCGEEIPKNRYYCDEHRPLKSDKKPKGRRQSAAGSGGSTAAPRPRRSKKADVAEVATMFYETAADIWSFRDPQCAAVVKDCAPAVGRTWADAAEHNALIRKMFEGMGEASVLLGLLMAHIPIILQIREHHVEPWVQEQRFAASLPPDHRARWLAERKAWKHQQREQARVAGAAAAMFGQLSEAEQREILERMRDAGQAPAA